MREVGYRHVGCNTRVTPWKQSWLFWGWFSCHNLRYYHFPFMEWKRVNECYELLVCFLPVEFSSDGYMHRPCNRSPKALHNFDYVEAREEKRGNLLHTWEQHAWKYSNMSVVCTKMILGLVWFPLFGARIKEFIYDSNNYLFGCHGIGYKIYLEFYGFSSHA
jgi:hypothetical protein